VARALGIRIRNWSEVELSALSDFAVVLDLIPDLNRWSDSERQAVVRIIRAKAAADEARYLKLMQRHRRLRAAMIKLGSGEN
jgi:succinate dehydrogenase/fumarate reductase-like Fe-S protein